MECKICKNTTEQPFRPDLPYGGDPIQGLCLACSDVLTQGAIAIRAQNMDGRTVDAVVEAFGLAKWLRGPGSLDIVSEIYHPGYKRGL